LASSFFTKEDDMIKNPKISIAVEGESQARESFALIVFSDHVFYEIPKISDSASAPITAALAERPLNTNLDLAKSVVGRFMLNTNALEAR
tara:strand:+ start:2337 stop:2606 length:270 start_codon:yes stop_codon:yes gene_type:complete